MNWVDRLNMNNMCLYGRLMKNPKYRVTKKNKGIVPHIKDERVRYVPVGCGLCSECLSKKANEWRMRLSEEINSDENGVFITLTFSDEAFTNLAGEIKAEGYVLDNEVATLATRRFLERWRKKYGKSVKHWLITELGHEGTENVHMHGIIWTKDYRAIEERWNAGEYKYGFVWDGTRQGGRVNYVSGETISYVTKYITKTDEDHKYYKPKILCSKGIGKGYMKRYGAKSNRYMEKDTKTSYTTESGHEIGLPIYYRNKIYSEEEREKLWLEKLDKGKRYVGGEEVDADDEVTYEKLVNYYRERDREMGYGHPENYDAMKYEHDRRKLMHETRMKRAKGRDPRGVG